jgi:adenosylmethionine-8-amino-7-oxononanoate aminotransferase
MSDLIILGTDTDAGKTTFALLWLAAFAEYYAYWKPLESGDSDSQRVRQTLPEVEVLPPMASYAEPVAPLLAARRIGEVIPTSRVIADSKPRPKQQSLLIETFGGPLSPLNERELQVELIRRLGLPCILVSSSAVGAIGRILSCLRSIEGFGIRPRAVVLLGEPDEFAAEQIGKSGGVGVMTLRQPESWEHVGIRRAAREQLAALQKLHELLKQPAGVGAADEKTLRQRDRQHVWHPYTSLRDHDDPLPVVGAQDEFLHLADGRRLIDGISSWWTILHGHRYAPLVAALSKALEQIDHVQFAGVTHPWAIQLAEQLLARTTWNGGRVFYSDNGSTAVEVALKMAYQFWSMRGEPQRTLFIGFEHGYHGDTFGAMSVGRDPLFFGQFEPLLFRAEIIPLSAQRLDEVLTRHRGMVAAVIVESLVQGAGGMRMHSPAELRDLFEVTRRHDVLLIVDEVMTGCGRTGTFWAHDAAEISPDLICAAKTLAGGMLPLAATLASPRIEAAWETDDRWQTFFHGHSFTAHPIACAVAAANLALLPQGANGRAQRQESFWCRALEPLRAHRQVADVRIRGSIAAVELDAEGGYLSEIGGKLRRGCLEHGVMLRPLGNVLYALPPLNTSDESLAQIALAMIQAVNDVRD